MMLETLMSVYEIDLDYLTNLPNDFHGYVQTAIMNKKKGKKIYRIDIIAVIYADMKMLK